MTIPQFVAGSVLQAAQLNAMVDAINAGGGKMEVTRFTASGTFTVPAGVTYAVAHLTGGGGGVGPSAGTGGTSSIAFASGTVDALGGEPMTATTLNNAGFRNAGTANSGNGATCSSDGQTLQVNLFGQNGANIVAGAAVTPAATITVTVGAGGVTGTNGAAGGSGYVFIEYVV